MKLVKCRKYKKGSTVPLEYFKYELRFDKETVNLICNKHKNPIDGLTDWCDENYGPMVPKDGVKGWNWAMWATPHYKNVEAIVFLHLVEDAMAFKLRWT